ncbi:MAG: DUF4235 domain-containing protein [Propionibacteriaceae bacterium]|nr:DUF4235 domain-containing protein [Propionibacteriaceae bacterium]
MNLVVKLLSPLLTGVAASLLTRLIGSGWRKATGEEPPNPMDPEVSTRKAIVWAGLTAVLSVAVQVLAGRAGAKVKIDPKKFNLPA